MGGIKNGDLITEPSARIALYLAAKLHGVSHERGLALGVVRPEAGWAQRLGVEMEHGLVDLPGVDRKAQSLRGEHQEHVRSGEWRDLRKLGIAQGI